MGEVEPKKKGEVIEGYRILSEIGQGAASIIYLVQEVRTKQVWALKHIVKDEPKDQRFLDQAESEYEIAAKLDHPGLRKAVRLMRQRHFLTVKELYLVMEYVDGVSIDRNRPTNQVDAVAIFQQVADALAAMHDAGYVHADMKPNNVIVSDKGVAKIIDLGQSCKSGTIKERIQGTPDYIAPEQVHRRAITPKTDIYNLGATMYWVLCGKHIPTAMPKGDKLVGSLDDAMIEKPTPPVQINPRINQRLSDLLMQCVEVDPEKRPEDMHWVADRLNLILGIVRAEAERKNGSGAPVALDSDQAD